MDSKYEYTVARPISAICAACSTLKAPQPRSPATCQAAVRMSLLRCARSRARRSSIPMCHPPFVGKFAQDGTTRSEIVAGAAADFGCERRLLAPGFAASGRPAGARCRLPGADSGHGRTSPRMRPHSSAGRSLRTDPNRECRAPIGLGTALGGKSGTASRQRRWPKRSTRVRTRPSSDWPGDAADTRAQGTAAAPALDSRRSRR